ncbi:hypothetical protein [Amycolatopsis sp. cg9]|uniref:hypothetical protein n=1 Tax=Amycolatopsis sp. cg9 TaxID=3238801 RepID=UPI003524B035
MVAVEVLHHEGQQCPLLQAVCGRGGDDPVVDPLAADLDANSAIVSSQARAARSVVPFSIVFLFSRVTLRPRWCGDVHSRSTPGCHKARSAGVLRSFTPRHE